MYRKKGKQAAYEEALKIARRMSRAQLFGTPRTAWVTVRHKMRHTPGLTPQDLDQVTSKAVRVARGEKIHDYL
jgi:hypothetical protein